MLMTFSEARRVLDGLPPQTTDGTASLAAVLAGQPDDPLGLLADTMRLRAVSTPEVDRILDTVAARCEDTLTGTN
jgi:hypothetical protein